MNLDEFMAATPPSRKRSPLWQHADAIRALKNKGYTYAQIREYLAKQGITVSTVRLCQFVRGELDITTYNTAADPIQQQSTPAPFTPPAARLAPKRSTASSQEISAEDMAEFLLLARHGQTTQKD